MRKKMLVMLLLFAGVANAEDVPEIQFDNQTPGDKAKVTSADIASAKPREHGPLGLVGQAIPHMDQALQLAIRAYHKTGRVNPIVGNDGTVYYPYGEVPPNIAVSASDDVSMRGALATIIQMEPGETVLEVTCHDKNFTCDIHNNGISTISVLAAYAGMNSTIEFKTDKSGQFRNYLAFLTSVDLRELYRRAKAAKKTDSAKLSYGKKRPIPVAAPFIPKVAFFFPGERTKVDMNAVLNSRRPESQPLAKASDFSCLPKSGAVPPSEYETSGDDELKPLYVTSDDTHTYIQMPPGIQDVPVIGFENEDGKEQTLNVGMANGCYIVPRLAKKFVLRLGDMKATIKRDAGWF